MEDAHEVSYFDAYIAMGAEAKTVIVALDPDKLQTLIDELGTDPQTPEERSASFKRVCNLIGEPLLDQLIQDIGDHGVCRLTQPGSGDGTLEREVEKTRNMENQARKVFKKQLESPKQGKRQTSRPKDPQ